MAKPRNNYLAALDIGTTKVMCVIAEVISNDHLNIIGIGHQASLGVKSGIITNIQKAENAIREAVGTAEQMASINVHNVMVNISGAKQQSHSLNVEIPIAHGQEITNKDIQRLREESCKSIDPNSGDIIHCIPIEYNIDNNGGITDPIGMFGSVLGGSVHIITASSSAITNLTNCLARCHLDVDRYITSSYASGYTCLNEDEKNLGAILVEFVGGNTTVSHFKNGHIIHIDSIPLGGIHITNDIALGLSTSVESAERIKNLYGSLFNSPGDSEEMIDIPQLNLEIDNENNHISRSNLLEIIKPRVEEILENVAMCIERNTMSRSIKNIVICGGASQLSGMKEFVSHYLNKNIRIGVPNKIQGLPDHNQGSAFCTVIGMLQYSFDLIKAKDPLGSKGESKLKAGIGTISKWFHDNL